MELLDRYLQAVRKHLPWKRQDDILAELRANLESQLEEREAELGRPLNQKEAEEWVKGLGNPMLMASKYQPVQYLIGPVLFPMYWYVLRMAFVWATIIYGIVAVIVIPLVSQHPENMVEAIFRWPSVLFTAATWVTLVFAVLEFIARTRPGMIPQLDAVTLDWKPSGLPPLEKAPVIGGKPQSYARAVAEVVFGFIFLAWLLLFPKHPFLMFGPGVYYLSASPFGLAPVWWHFYLFVVALNVVQLTWQCIDLIRGTWQSARTLQHVTSKMFGLIAVGLLVSAPGQILVTLRDQALNGAKYGSVAIQINKSLHLGLLVVMAIFLIQLLWDLAQLGMYAYKKKSAAVTQ